MNILLNYLPPADVRYPSLALSTLKSFLATEGYHTDIKYWNIFLEDIQKQFLNNKPDFDIDADGLLLFINYILVHSKNSSCISDLKYYLLSVFPKWNSLRKDYLSNRMLQYAYKLEDLIASELKAMNIEKYTLFGISTKFHQWLCGGIIANIVKKIFPKIKIVIGGIGTADEAIALMRNFEYYDYAIWGEGEYPLLQLCKSIENSSSIADIPFLAHRNNANNPQISSQSKKKLFFDMNNNTILDYSDFFTQNTTHISKVILPIEKSRGCHWNKCNFCYLNDGYKYRVKAVDTAINEIEQLISRYSIKRFIQVDNDITGRDIKEFESYLDNLISIKNSHNDFEIISAEVVTKNINSLIIKKMVLAGFKSIQIGYESSSNRLLAKINKKNTFASNLLFIKWSCLFSLSLSSTNVIMGLIEETLEDIMESIDNLDYLRFFLSESVFRHNYTLLHISTSSPYFHIIEKQGDLDNWCKSHPTNLLPPNYIAPKDHHILFNFHRQNQKYQWNYFKKVERFYLTSNYYYKLFLNDNNIHYCEYYNGNLINGLIFEDDLVHWSVLKLCNHQVQSLAQLQAELIYEKPNDIISAIELLRDEKILYANDDLSEVVSVINTDEIL